MNATSPTEDLIEQAMSACRTLPPLEQLAELDGQLRAALEQLTPIVEERQTGHVARGTVGFYDCDRALNASRNALDVPLADSPLAAAMHVAELGRALRGLSVQAGKADDAR